MFNNEERWTVIWETVGVVLFVLLIAWRFIDPFIP